MTSGLELLAGRSGHLSAALRDAVLELLVWEKGQAALSSCPTPPLAHLSHCMF